MLPTDTCSTVVEEDCNSVGDSLMSRLDDSFGFEFLQELSFEQFVSVDCQAITTPELTTEDVVATFMGNNDCEDEAEIDDSEVLCQPPTQRETEAALLTLPNFFQLQEGAKRQLKLITELERNVSDCAIKSYKQSSIRDYVCVLMCCLYSSYVYTNIL